MAEEQREQPSNWRPNISFYRSNPRSNAIRETCIPAINALDRLLRDPGVGKNPDLRSSMYSQLEEANGKLVELGIEPGMHLGKPFGAFQASSVTAAEFLASQLIPLTGRSIPSEADVMPIIEEFTEEKAGNARIVDSQTLPDKAQDFRVVRGAVEFIKDSFDIKPENNKEEQAD